MEEIASSAWQGVFQTKNIGSFGRIYDGVESISVFTDEKLISTGISCCAE